MTLHTVVAEGVLIGRRSALALTAAAACWGLALVATKGVLAYMPPFSLLALQLLGSVTFLWLAVAIRRDAVPWTAATRRVAMAGLLEPALSYAATVPGIALTSVGNAAVIGASEPALVGALAWLLLHERPQRGVLAATGLAVAGVVLVTLADRGAEGGRLAGDVLVLLGTLVAALYVVASGRFGAVASPLVLAAMQQTVGLALAIALLGGAVAIGAETVKVHLSARLVGAGLASGVVQFALAFWFYLIGIRGTRAGTAAVFLALIPVFGVAGGAALLGEPVTLAQVVGCACVLIAVIRVARRLTLA